MEATDWNIDVAEEEEASASWLTVERAAYVAIGLLAAALRFLQLGLRPLTESEAIQALAAYRFTQGAAQAAPPGTIPSLFTGNLLAFTLMGANDVSARWLPALAGLVLALLPYALRHRLGRGGALSASLLLAISPTAVYFSRNLASAILVATCGLAMVIGLINYVDTRRPGYLYLIAVALGLGLCTGPGFYTLLFIQMAFLLVLYLGERLLKRETGWSSLLAAWGVLRGEVGLLARTGAVLAGSFGLVATAFVLHPAGVGHAADLVGDWIRGFWAGAASQPPLYPLLLLLRYEPLILFLGLVEMGHWLLRGRSSQRGEARYGSLFPHTALLAFWAVAATLVVLVAGYRSAGNLLLAVVPLALLAGQGVQRACGWIGRRQLWFEAGVAATVALGIVIFFYLQLAAYGQSSGAGTVSFAGISLYASSTYLILATVALVLLAGLTAVAWLWRGREVVIGGGWLTAVVVLTLVGFNAMWRVNSAHATDARELMIMQSTAPDVRQLVDHLEALSLDKAGDAHTLSFTVDAATGPVVAWYLREFKQQSVVEGLSAPPETIAAVTLAAQDLPIGQVFRGKGYPLSTHWLPWGLRGQGLVRWLLFNEGDLPVVDQEVVLWVAGEP